MASNDSSNYDIKSLELCPNQSNGSLQLTVLWKHNATTGSDEGSLFLLSELKSKLAPTLGESKFKKMTANKGSELWGKIQQVKGPTVAKLVQAGVVRGGDLACSLCRPPRPSNIFESDTRNALDPSRWHCGYCDNLGRAHSTHVGWQPSSLGEY